MIVIMWYPSFIENNAFVKISILSHFAWRKKKKKLKTKNITKKSKKKLNAEKNHCSKKMKGAIVYFFK